MTSPARRRAEGYELSNGERSVSVRTSVTHPSRRAPLRKTRRRRAATRAPLRRGRRMRGEPAIADDIGDQDRRERAEATRNAARYAAEQGKDGADLVGRWKHAPVARSDRRGAAAGARVLRVSVIPWGLRPAACLRRRARVGRDRPHCRFGRRREPAKRELRVDGEAGLHLPARLVARWFGVA